jgi:hypothetical protein
MARGDLVVIQVDTEHALVGRIGLHQEVVVHLSDQLFLILDEDTGSERVNVLVV